MQFEWEEATKHTDEKVKTTIRVLEEADKQELHEILYELEDETWLLIADTLQMLIHQRLMNLKAEV